ncbi:cytochrome b [Primorskyibacter flagellatus]|uniref:Cytochrome b561 n=1 Tax=Primorskyibacter flagellatus TaxID=1387277 RepID=A0A1W2E2A8_9RHOB|nr:cytochrome b [Primorskyibacter flagellatus]SMD03859.1 cytochrome b561 [Primorskyibacter flagellatus]
MDNLSDRPDRFGPVSRALHWSMAALFALQFLSAAAHWALPRDNALRQTLWSYHIDLGVTLFLLVLLRGAWALWNLRRRPRHSGLVGRAATAGHAALYALMMIVPVVKIPAAAGGTRGLSYLGLSIFPARETAIAWTQAAAGWHGGMGWMLAALVLGHIVMVLGWHRFIKRDDVLSHMA